MSRGVGNPQIGQWYLRCDTDELFQVTGIDEGGGTIEIQTFDGDLVEIEAETWRLLPMTFAEPPQDWVGSIDDDLTEDTGIRIAALPGLESGTMR